MLKLVKITKDYKLKDQESVHALRGITINFRRNEFVAILGHSGCGKTTLLNIIGGLDHYTSGNLFIEGWSTKKYTDQDWDTYRNHSIGFVFQTYNLITHQNILKNVELALTISGISKTERRNRAMAALDKVGLKGYYRKKPNQMSGGQMQRVAIARALVNNPEILLADEPTGALDSETSIQIMDLLKEVAKDRLVIMVTHNPELAYEYANRIVKMKDGKLMTDSNPYCGESKQEREAFHKEHIDNVKRKKHSSMAFHTAFGLSLANLGSKFRRTALVAVAGSIGIIGISSVLAVSNGINKYIDSMQDDMLSAYPVSISEKSVDYTTLATGLSSLADKEIAEFDITNKVGMDSMIAYMMDKYQDLTSVKTNEINEDLIQFINDMPEFKEYVSSIDYKYGLDLTNNIFTSFKDNDQDSEHFVSLNGLTQRYISELTTVDGFSDYAMFVDLFTNFMMQLPGDEEYVLRQYDLLGNSRFAKEANEIMLVVDSNQTLTDFTLAQMGYYQEEDFLNIAKKAIEEAKETPNQELINSYTYESSFSFDDILNHKFYYYPHDDMYEYREIKRDAISFILPMSESSNVKFDLNYNASCDRLEGTLNVAGSGYATSFERVTSSSIDQENKAFGEWYTIFMDQEYCFKFSQFGTNYMVSLKAGNFYMPVGTFTYEKNKITHAGYMYDTFAHQSWAHPTEVKVVGILKPKKNINFGCLTRGVYYTSKLTEKYMNDAKNSKIITDSEHGFEQFITSGTATGSVFKAYTTYTYTSWIKDTVPTRNVEGIASCLNTSLSGSFSSLMGGGSDALERNKAYLRALSGLAVKSHTNEDGFAEYNLSPMPYEIDFYLSNFENKNVLTSYLDEWNNEDSTITLSNGKVLNFEDRHELTYSDTIEMIVKMVNTLIKAITIALIVFTSLSLVVSCFMIAVITYISVMERVKEIGVIRSLGGRKKDVSRLFTAENLITGLSSGIVGVGVTLLICLIINLIVAPFGVSNIAKLEFLTAVIMVCLSVFLSVMSGLVPSLRASKQDPAVALRTE